LVAASELSLQELIIHLQSFLIVNKKDWLEQNFSLVYKTSFENDSFLKLQNFCSELISNEPEKIFNSIDFISLSEKALISIIQHDNLQMNAIQVWEHVLKWGIAQNPGLPSDLSNYSKDDFNTLKNNLQQFIPFIKFINLSHEEFSNKVYPYKKVIPKDLRENLIKHFIGHPKTIIKEISPKSIDSKIITFQHAETISNWENNGVAESSNRNADSNANISSSWNDNTNYINAGNWGETEDNNDWSAGASVLEDDNASNDAWNIENTNWDQQSETTDMWDSDEYNKTFDEYLAEKAQKSLDISIPKARKPNEGVDDSQWKNAVPFEKANDDDFLFTGKVSKIINILKIMKLSFFIIMLFTYLNH
jgi:hypothetical protein